MMTLEKYMKDQGEDRKEWGIGYKLDWMTEDQWLCYLFLDRLFRGFHHVPTTPKPHGKGIEINFRSYQMATYDYDYLTKLVIMSHNWGVRVCINGSAPGMIKMTLHKRHKREGGMSERMPEISEMIEANKAN